MNQGQDLDVVSEVILHARLEGVVAEMATTLANIARSVQLSTARDFACAIVASDGTVVATENPAHLPSLVDTTGACLDYYEFDLDGDDVMLTNDPYSGGLSLHYFTLVAPVVSGDEIAAYVSVQAHAADIGGVVRGNYHPKATELWAEGARFTPLKVVRGGKLRRDAMDTVLLNSRDPENLRGDLDAALATIRVARRRLGDLLGDYGLSTVAGGMASLVDYSERRFRAALATIPEGRYSGEAVLDHDGQGRENLAVRVVLERSDDRTRLDFDGTDEQSTGFVNSSWSNTRGQAIVPFLGLAESIPASGGLLNALEFDAPDGTLVTPAFPAPTGFGRSHVGCEVAEAVSAALARALPVDTGFSARRRSLIFTVRRECRIGDVIEQTAREDYAALSAPGASATPFGDGWGVATGGFRGLLPSVEEFEAETAATVARLEYGADSCGAGQFRGAPGTQTVIRFARGDGDHLYAFVTGRAHPPLGRAGGLPAAGGSVRMARAAGEGLEWSDAALVECEAIRPGTEVVIATPGGAGWGHPKDRDRASVEADVRDGYLSQEEAGSIYGYEAGAGDHELAPRPATV